MSDNSVLGRFNNRIYQKLQILLNVQLEIVQYRYNRIGNSEKKEN